jgi:exopolyphosphatase/guanosine-5'-triphosphate,3'-diphosphate pyrophosphatase
MVQAARGGEPLRTYNRFEFSRAELEEVVSRDHPCQTVERSRIIAGLEPPRADIIVAGALALEAIADSFEVPAFTFSEYALREGVLLDTIERHKGGMLHHLRDVSRRSVRHLAERCDDDLAHSAHVARLAVQLFDATAPVHGLDPTNREYLEAARAPRERRPADLAQPPPHPLVLRHPQQRRPHRVHGCRDRDHRPHRPVPPQVSAEGIAS